MNCWMLDHWMLGDLVEGMPLANLNPRCLQSRYQGPCTGHCRYAILVWISDLGPATSFLLLLFFFFSSPEPHSYYECELVTWQECFVCQSVNLKTE